jgi:predicted O-linked N-acetylglucosamine transferase (SPINDLY family)
VTFACLNNPAKVTPATLDLWADVVAAMPKSRPLLIDLVPIPFRASGDR